MEANWQKNGQSAVTYHEEIEIVLDPTIRNLWRKKGQSGLSEIENKRLFLKQAGIGPVDAKHPDNGQ